VLDTDELNECVKEWIMACKNQCAKCSTQQQVQEETKEEPVETDSSKNGQ